MDCHRICRLQHYTSNRTNLQQAKQWWNPSFPHTQKLQSFHKKIRVFWARQGAKQVDLNLIQNSKG
jgi:hypothetical protein